MNSSAVPGFTLFAGDPVAARTRLHDERVRFETLLARLSARFINLPADEVDGQVERGLGEIVAYLGIERSSLAQFSEDGDDLIVTHSFTTKPGGMGMGLAICRSIVHAHGGRIRTVSAPGVGTTFHVTLPALAEVAP